LWEKGDRMQEKPDTSLPAGTWLEDQIAVDEARIGHGDLHGAWRMNAHVPQPAVDVQGIEDVLEISANW
jgi:hypothetical protein